MKVSNKNDSLSSYPILSNYKRDYLNTSFTSEIGTPVIEFGEIVIRVGFKLEGAEELKKLIKEKKAAYYIHIECSYTCYRKRYKTFDNKIEIRIPVDKVGFKLEVTAMIIAETNILGYKSKSFNPVYEDLSFNIMKYQIMAFGDNCDLILETDNSLLEKNEGIIRYQNIKDLKQSLVVNLERSEYILVGLREDLYTQVVALGRISYPQTIMSLVIIPTMIYVLQTMYQNKENEEFREKHWYQVIENMLEKNNYPLKNLTGEFEEILLLIEKIFRDPLSNAAKELYSSIERGDE